MRQRLLVVLAGAVAGALAGLLVTLLQDDVYRADGSIAIVRQGAAPGSDPALAASAEAAAELFDSRAVAESVIANLRLDDSSEELLDRVEVTAEPGSSLVRLEVEADDPESARRTAQNLAEVATVLFNDRFGPETSASIWESPRADADPASPRTARSVALGALLGALAGLLVSLLRSPPRAGRGWSGGGWLIEELEPAAAGEGREAEDRRLYLDALRDYAGEDGSLDPAFDDLVEEVFGDALPARRR